MSKGRHWKRAKNKCALCGRRVTPSDKSSCVVGATGNMVCSSCLRVSKRILEMYKLTQPPVTNSKATDKVMKPAYIIDELDKSIIGQAEAKQAVAIALWKQWLRVNKDLDVPKQNLLLYGPTGCGKTAIVETAANIVGLPFISFDASTLTEAGYRGKDAADIIKDLVSSYDGNGDVRNAVIFLDEIDKLSARGDSTRQAYCRGTQHSLLKLIENGSVEVDGDWISTKNMLFVFGGAFTGISLAHEERPSVMRIGFLAAIEEPDNGNDEGVTVDDFIRYGMEPELMGRIGQVVPVHALTELDLARILLESDRSAYLDYKRFFQEAGIVLTLSQSEAEMIAKQAVDRGTGVRGLNSLIEQRVEHLLLRLSEGQLQGTVSVIEGGEGYGRVS